MAQQLGLEGERIEALRLAGLLHDVGKIGVADVVLQEVPLESRIILVADAFEAMTSDRPYRAAHSMEDALAELARHSGIQFDPACVAALQPALAFAALAAEPATSRLAS